ncbi:MAG: class I SAM-dependent methyltransferase [Oscillatoria princeps RMCB-10]|jgi:ubiquinone/menaquinone biosynthesis C-methylase UbiE|nr:class I SAM-dependent methyltransferase [Oscillatoria princeps RMCB-10]
MDAQDIQLQYYRNTAYDYTQSHVHENDEHFTAMRLICCLCSQIELTSILDTGCGTGRGVNYFKNHFPQCRAIGNDISADLLTVATSQYQIHPEDLICCSSYELPFDDNSFDLVTEFGILHHVAEPDRVVSEMLRVARKAIFISDSNRFAQGGLLSRLAKLLLYKSGLWWPLRQMLNGGKRWNYSEGDGVYYSYSVFDSFKLIEASCQNVFAIPTIAARGTAISPLIFAPHLLLCGFK